MLESIIMEADTIVATALSPLGNTPDEATYSVIGDIQAGESVIFQEWDPVLVDWRNIVNNSTIQALTAGETTLVTVSKLNMRLYKGVTANPVGVRLTR